MTPDQALTALSRCTSAGHFAGVLSDSDIDACRVAVATARPLTIFASPGPKASLTVAVPTPWHEAVMDGFLLIACRATAGDQEAAEFLTRSQVTLIDRDGRKVWPSADPPKGETPAPPDEAA